MIFQIQNYVEITGLYMSDPTTALLPPWAVQLHWIVPRKGPEKGGVQLTLQPSIISRKGESIIDFGPYNLDQIQH